MTRKIKLDVNVRPYVEQAENERMTPGACIKQI